MLVFLRSLTFLKTFHRRDFVNRSHILDFRHFSESPRPHRHRFSISVKEFTIR